MNLFPRVIGLLCVAASLIVIPALTHPTSAKPSRTTSQKGQTSSAIGGVTLNLSDFGAAGDGVTDDGPAFQRGVDALAAAGGGTLFVPAGRYLVGTTVAKSFSAVSNATVRIQGVPSSTMPAPPTAGGHELMLGLDLTSEIIVATGPNHVAFSLTYLRELSFEHLVFLGRPQETTDAVVTLNLENIDKATIHHCEFYGLSSLGGGNIVRAVQSELTIELSVFLGCTANSGAYGAVVENLLWKKFVISNSIFLDYGGRPNFFSKTGLGAPLSWIDIGNAAAPTPESPRREFVVRDTFLDEGGWVGISAFPYRWGPTARIDLLYISGLKMNVSNMGTAGHLLYDIANVLIENSHYGWSHNAYAAIDLNRVENAIFDNLTCINHADRLRADSGTGRLTVINSVYAGLDSAAQITNVVNTTPEEDPVQYVRQQFLSALGRQPDPAAHFYWSDKLVRCGTNNDCLTEKRSELNLYLGQIPQVDFSINGTVVDIDGEPLSDAAVSLTGSQTSATVTDSEGKFRFANLPTSGSYTVAVSKLGYNFASKSFIHPASDTNAVFQARLVHSIGGRITRANGTGLSGVTVQVDQSPALTVSTNASGHYSFSELPAGQNYTIVPSSPDFEFTPASTSFQNLSSNQTANFTGNQTNVSITGTVLDEADGPMNGVTVNLTGSQSATASTDAQGNFSFSGLPTSGNYTVTVNKQHYSFVPASQNFLNPSDNVTVSFQAQLNRHSISGRITRTSGTGLSGVTVQLAQSPATSVISDANGNYSFPELPAGQTFTIVPSLPDFEFTPASTSFLNLSSNQTANFIGGLTNVSITGTVLDEVDGPMSGVTVNLTGSQSTTVTTDAQGNFSFSGLPTSGSYTVTVSKQHYSFVPASQSVVSPVENVIVGFQARLNRHSINGRITRSDGTGVSGLTLRLSETTTAVTDLNGYYSFLELPAGQSYTVVPSSSAFVFTPMNTTLVDLSTTQTVNFVGKLKPRLLTIDASDIAVALDSTSFISQPFSIVSSFGFSGDGLTRLAVFSTNIEPTTASSEISVAAEDDEGHIYPLEIEYFGDVPGQIWLKQLNIKLSQTMPTDKCLKLKLTVAGVVSNDARICIAGAGSSSSLAR
jgi:hypothetical protein